MTIQGKSVYSGVAIGRLAIYRKSENQVKREKITDTAKEVKRFEDAKDTAKQQLAGLYDKALKEVGEVNAAIFEVHQMMLNDLDYIESITNMPWQRPEIHFPRCLRQWMMIICVSVQPMSGMCQTA